MNKKIIIIIALVLAVVLLIIIFRPRSIVPLETKITTEEEYSVATMRNYLSALPSEEVVAEFMTNEEKEAIGLTTVAGVGAQQIQVLNRDDQGRITQYRLIHSDKDIVKRRMVQ